MFKPSVFIKLMKNVIYTLTERGNKVMSNRIYTSEKQGLESTRSKMDTCSEQMFRSSKQAQWNHRGQWVAERLMWLVTREVSLLWMSLIPRCSHPGQGGKTHED